MPGGPTPLDPPRDPDAQQASGTPEPSNATPEPAPSADGIRAIVRRCGSVRPSQAIHTEEGTGRNRTHAPTEVDGQGAQMVTGACPAGAGANGNQAEPCMIGKTPGLLIHLPHVVDRGLPETERVQDEPKPQRERDDATNQPPENDLDRRRGQREFPVE